MSVYLYDKDESVINSASEPANASDISFSLSPTFSS